MVRYTGGTVKPELYLAASKAFTELFEQALRCKDLYIQAESTPPQPLIDFLGLQARGKSERVVAERPRISIVLPHRPREASLPPEAGEKWISVQVHSAALSSVIRAVVRADGPVSYDGLLFRLEALGDGIVKNSTSIYNAVSRLLQEKRLVKDEDGKLRVVDDENAPLLVDDYLWGSPDTFYPQDIAAFRREVLYYMLANNQRLDTTPAVDALRELPWFPPYNKDAFKGDMNSLQDDGYAEKADGGRGWKLGKGREV